MTITFVASVVLLLLALAEEECQHDIAFVPDEEDEQRNECRDSILSYLKACDISNGRWMAKRLQKVTTNKSGLGLLFLMMGQHKFLLVLSV
jgi:hypothetical protein